MPPPQDPPSASGTASGAVVFFHPDLGIGGAERLVVDAAVGLQRRGHKVVVFTNHCDPGHCFDECRDGTLDVRVYGDWLPMSLLNRLTILCAIARHIYLLLYIYLSGELGRLRPRVFIVDQLSAGLPLMRVVAPLVPILFYCHFPDLLLVQGRQSLVKRLYRLPFDWIEQWSMTFAHAVAVNSEFTKGIVEATWPRLRDSVETKVVYPCVDTNSPDETPNRGDALFGEECNFILSINRFERKKNIDLAVRAFAAVPESHRKGVRLVLAGGYDPRVAENVQYHRELQDLATSLSLKYHTVPPSATSAISSTPPDASVVFLPSVPNSLKTRLLQQATLLLYTPSNEHFGIVPLEAMLSRLPVLACNTGGPIETIVDEGTGWLRDPEDVAAWARVVRDVLDMPGDALARMGDEGAERVRRLFGRDKLALRIEAIVDEIVRRGGGSGASVGMGGLLLALALGYAIYMWR